MTKSLAASRRRFRSLARVEFDPQALLPAEATSQEIRYLFSAADAVDSIFWQQVSPDINWSSLLEGAGEDRELREMILFHYGPYDRLDNDSPFLPVAPKPLGAGFYPRDLTRKELTSYLHSHPGCRPSFESPYTVIRRADRSQLIAVPYHEAYGEQVASLSRLLAEAGRSASHTRFGEFLAQRAVDLLNDDYYASDSLWVRLLDNPLDLVIGPYEVYEDQLMGAKAAYEAMLLARHLVDSSKVQHFQDELPSLCQRLERKVKKPLNVERSRVALSVANLVYAAGDARKAIPAIAFSLPNDERIIEEVGSRQVILKNVLEAKFRLVDWRLQKRLLHTPLDDEGPAFRRFFDHALFHEISHSIGPHRITRDGQATTVNRSLKQHYSILEETKADVLAACFVLQTINDSDARAFLEAYVCGFLRPIRFGLSTAHGGANAIQFNFLLREGAFAIHPESGRILVDQVRASQSLPRLVSNVIDIQERGDFEAAHRFVTTFCVISPEISGLTDRVGDLPIDIRISFKANHSHLATGPLIDHAIAT